MVDEDRGLSSREAPPKQGGQTQQLFGEVVGSVWATDLLCYSNAHYKIPKNLQTGLEQFGEHASKLHQITWNLLKINVF